MVSNMGEQLNRQKIGDGVYYCNIIEERFKTNKICVQILLPLEKETVTGYAILPFLLCKGYRGCPDFTQLNRKLCEMYGATLDGDTSKIGDSLVVSLHIQGIDDRFALNQEKIASDCTKLLCDILLDPNFENGVFRQEDIETERRMLIEEIDAEINEKRTYAIGKCLEIICEGEPGGIPKYGYKEDAMKITAESAAESYRKMMKTGQVEIMFIGGGDPSAAKAIFEKAFANMQREPLAVKKPVFHDPAGQPREVVQTMEVSQSKLVLGFRTGAASDTETVDALRMVTAIYGATPISKLFRNVREKLSLCYYCAARYDKNKGILLVDCGIQGENKQKAQDEILRQLRAVQEGDFDEYELETNRMSLINSFTTLNDSLGGLQAWYFDQIYNGSGISPEDQVKRIQDVSRDRIVRAAQMVKLDAVYFLTGKDK